ncbi:MAG: IS630 family transposase [Caulobacteraceae bacterium]
MRSRGSPDEFEPRRWLAVQRVSEGYSTQEVADFLGVDPSTVRRWRATFRGQGVHGLAARPVSGRPRKLTLTQEKIALRWLTESPLHHGFETALWTAPRLGQLIREEYGVLLHPRSLSAWLRDRGLTPQKPQRVPRERDPKAIAAWLKSDGPRINNKARRLGAAIALIDERGLLRAPLARRTGSPRGQTPDLVPKRGTRAKVSVAAALGLSPRRDWLGLYYLPGPTATARTGM